MKRGGGRMSQIFIPPRKGGDLDTNQKRGGDQMSIKWVERLPTRREKNCRSTIWQKGSVVVVLVVAVVVVIVVVVDVVVVVVVVVITVDVVVIVADVIAVVFVEDVVVVIRSALFSLSLSLSHSLSPNTNKLDTDLFAPKSITLNEKILAKLKKKFRQENASSKFFSSFSKPGVENLNCCRTNFVFPRLRQLDPPRPPPPPSEF